MMLSNISNELQKIHKIIIQLQLQNIWVIHVGIFAKYLDVIRFDQVLCCKIALK